MDKEPRKATDVLLELESKISTLLAMIRNQDLNLKLISNKLNSVIDKLEQDSNTSTKITVEAINEANFINEKLIEDESSKNIPVDSDFNIALDSSPQGFRRTSRPETFSGDNMYLKRKEDSPANLHVQVPKFDTDVPEIKVPSEESNISQSFSSTKQTPSSTSIPIIQRVVDKNGKSIFLADVEVINLETNSSIFKTRTNGTGKWMASLSVGNYKIIVRKRESLTKERLESTQIVQIDGTQSPFELSTLIIR